MTRRSTWQMLLQLDADAATKTINEFAERAAKDPADAIKWYGEPAAKAHFTLNFAATAATHDEASIPAGIAEALRLHRCDPAEAAKAYIGERPSADLSRALHRFEFEQRLYLWDRYHSATTADDE